MSLRHLFSSPVKPGPSGTRAHRTRTSYLKQGVHRRHRLPGQPVSQPICLTWPPQRRLAGFGLQFECTLPQLTPRRFIKPDPISHLRRDTCEHFIESGISHKEGSKGLMALTAHPLPVLCCRLAMHLR